MSNRDEQRRRNTEQIMAVARERLPLEYRAMSSEELQEQAAAGKLPLEVRRILLGESK